MKIIENDDSSTFEVLEISNTFYFDAEDENNRYKNGKILKIEF